MVGLVFACHLGGASSNLGHSIEGSEVCLSGDRSSLLTWFGSHVKLLVPLLNNHWFHAALKLHTNKLSYLVVPVVDPPFGSVFSVQVS